MYKCTLLEGPKKITRNLWSTNDSGSNVGIFLRTEKRLHDVPHLSGNSMEIRKICSYNVHSTHITFPVSLNDLAFFKEYVQKVLSFKNRRK
jgi:hypothetical protein